MAITLIINPGSSSKKYAFFKGEEGVLSVRFEKMREGYGRCIAVNQMQQKQDAATEHQYAHALHEAIGVAKTQGVIASVADITHVGIRIVSPGEEFAKHRIITEQYFSALSKKAATVPLHIPPVLEEIARAGELLSHATLVAISDSAFHQTIPISRRQYSLRAASEQGIVQYGYHGLSVASVVRQLDEFGGMPTARVIVAHIGSGVSVTAVTKSQSVWTTMGYTPASGMIMGTRAGDIDPGALIDVLAYKKLFGQKAHAYIQSEGGLYGLTGSADLRTVMDRAASGDALYERALDAYVLRIQQSIAGAAVALGGVDTLVLTATAMERNPALRQRIVSGLRWCGLVLDHKKNERTFSRIEHLAADESCCPIILIPTDEMGEMAHIVKQFVS